MINVTRFDPFQACGLDPFDDVIRGLFRPVKLENKQEVLIKIDVREDDKSYTVYAEIPGVRKEDLHVSIEGNQVSINAETRHENEVKEGGKVLRSERYYGKSLRSFSLGSEVDENASYAKYADGILELTLPKKAVSSARKLSIN
jgi:HSP20 family protein